jgi:hypothetical protein
MTDLAIARTLAELADQPGANPAVIIDGIDAVVLGRTTSGAVAVYRAGNLHEYHGEIPAVAIASTDDRLDVLERAVRDVATWREAATATADELHTVLPRIRAYAIERHREGLICRQGLNDFLAEFELPEYDPRLKVTYTITGSFEVDGADEHNARQALAELRVVLPDWHDVDEDTSDYHADLEELDLIDRGEDDL